MKIMMKLDYNKKSKDDDPDNDTVDNITYVKSGEPCSILRHEDNDDDESRIGKVDHNDDVKDSKLENLVVSILLGFPVETEQRHRCIDNLQLTIK